MVASEHLRPGVKQPLPLSVYVHLPWCLKKCPYCDFNSHEATAEQTGGASTGLDPASETQYVDALQADLESALPDIWGRVVQTIFIGGGTPSLFSATAIDRLLAMIRARVRLSADAEITLEANPGTFEAQRFRDYAAAGVNRLSIGVQSFDDSMLRALGRVHDSDQARRAIEVAAQAFATFNIDLMYALPGQSHQQLINDLRTALSYSPPHFSYYQLTLEPNTVFAKYPPALPDEDRAAAMQEAIESELAGAGYGHYEVSAYARPGHRARHNLNYWQFGDYLGIGAGAHGKLSFHDRIVRESRFKQPRRYQQAALAGAAIEQRRELTRSDLPFEFMLNVLRLADGVPAGLFAERTGIGLASVSRTLQQAVDRGLVDPDPGLIKPTALGLRFLNDLQALFL